MNHSQFKNNVVPFKKKKYKKQKKYNKDAINHLESLTDSFKDSKIEGFVLLAWVEDGRIYQARHSTSNCDFLTMCGALEVYKQRLIEELAD